MMDAHDQLFTKNENPVKFLLHVSIRLPGQIQALTRDIENHGGRVVPSDNEADVVLVNPANYRFTIEELQDSYSTHHDLRKRHIYVEQMSFIQGCVSQGRYAHRRDAIRRMPGIPPSEIRARQEFTPQDRENLCQYLAVKVPNKEYGGRQARNLYIEMVEKGDVMPGEYQWAKRHTWESWKEHYKKNAVVLDPRIDEIVRENGGIIIRNLYPYRRNNVPYQRRQRRQRMRYAVQEEDEQEDYVPNQRRPRVRHRLAEEEEEEEEEEERYLQHDIDWNIDAPYEFAPEVEYYMPEDNVLQGNQNMGEDEDEVGAPRRQGMQKQLPESDEEDRQNSRHSDNENSTPRARQAQDDEALHKDLFGSFLDEDEELGTLGYPDQDALDIPDPVVEDQQVLEHAEASVEEREPSPTLVNPPSSQRAKASQSQSQRKKKNQPLFPEQPSVVDTNESEDGNIRKKRKIQHSGPAPLERRSTAARKIPQPGPPASEETDTASIAPYRNTRSRSRSASVEPQQRPQSRMTRSRSRSVSQQRPKPARPTKAARGPPGKWHASPLSPIQERTNEDASHSRAVTESAQDDEVVLEMLAPGADQTLSVIEDLPPAEPQQRRTPRRKRDLSADDQHSVNVLNDALDPNILLESAPPTTLIKSRKTDLSADDQHSVNVLDKVLDPDILLENAPPVTLTKSRKRSRTPQVRRRFDIGHTPPSPQASSLFQSAASPFRRKVSVSSAESFPAGGTRARNMREKASELEKYSPSFTPLTGTRAHKYLGRQGVKN